MIIEKYFKEIMTLILTMTLAGSILSIILFAIKPLIKHKLPKSFQYYMWFPIIMAYMLPLSKIAATPISGASAMPVKSMHGIVRQTSSFPHIIAILFIVWQFGMILNLGFHIIGYTLYARRLKKHNANASQHEIALLNKLSTCKNAPPLYKNPIVTAPILLGVFRPAIILPDKKYEDKDLRGILMHETTHMRQHDIAVKWLLIFAGALHWFNPIMYFVRQEIDKACELACDEAVIRKFGSDEMRQYGDTLITVAADAIRKTPVPITKFESKKNLKERLNAIMNHKKYSKKSVIMASIILGLAACGILSLLPASGSKKDNEKWVINNIDPSRQKNYQAVKLKEAICAYEKKNIVDAYVDFGNSDENITNATILVICQAKNPSPEMKSGIQTLVSEKLALDEQDIRIDYLDVETFTSPDTQDIYLD